MYIFFHCRFYIVNDTSNCRKPWRWQQITQNVNITFKPFEHKILCYLFESPSPTLGAILKAEVYPWSTKHAGHKLQRVTEKSQHNTMLLIQTNDKIRLSLAKLTLYILVYLDFTQVKNTRSSRKTAGSCPKRTSPALQPVYGWWLYQHTWCNDF